MHDGNNTFWLGDEEPEFAVNEAALYFDNNNLVVAFGDGRNVVMELENDEERGLVRTVLSDVNFWANFVTALSTAIGKHR